MFYDFINFIYEKNLLKNKNEIKNIEFFKYFDFKIIKLLNKIDEKDMTYINDLFKDNEYVLLNIHVILREEKKFFKKYPLIYNFLKNIKKNINLYLDYDEFSKYVLNKDKIYIKIPKTFFDNL